MLSYIIKRILYFIPAFFSISLVIFFLSKAAGEILLCEQDPLGIDIEQCKLEAHQKGYDKPVFYFSLTTAAHPDTLYRIFREERRAALRKLIEQYGNWEEISQYYDAINLLEKKLETIQYKDKSSSFVKIQAAIELLYVSYKEEGINQQLTRLKVASIDSTLHSIQSQTASVIDSYQQIKEKSSPHKLYIPSLNWYGTDNQYHFWIANFLRGELGTSIIDYNPVSQKIKEKLPWTLILNIPAIILAYLLSIPLGVYTAVYKNTGFDKFTSAFLLILYSLPAFWIGTLLINFLTTPEYGMKFFPSIDFSVGGSFLDNANRFILPIFCLTYGSLAFITRQMRSSMIATLQQDFIRTARAKGLSEWQIIWKHAFRNSLFPLITIFGAVFPAAFAGSVIIEFIFNIPGMGWLMLKSISARDWPVVYAILMIAAILTMFGLLIADILYTLADPRVRLNKSKT